MAGVMSRLGRFPMVQWGTGQNVLAETFSSPVYAPSSFFSSSSSISRQRASSITFCGTMAAAKFFGDYDWKFLCMPPNPVSPVASLLPSGPCSLHHDRETTAEKRRIFVAKRAGQHARHLSPANTGHVVALVSQRARPMLCLSEHHLPAILTTALGRVQVKCTCAAPKSPASSPYGISRPPPSQSPEYRTSLPLPRV